MKFKGKCQVCDREFENTSQGRVNANLANHMKTHGGGSASKATVEAAGNKPKRPYTRKPKTAIGANFCPQCGCNMQAVRVALSL